MGGAETIGAAGGKQKLKCTHSSNQKCPNCIGNDDEGMVQDRKHESFDSFLTEMFKKCAKSHGKSQKC